jgi:peptidoglycan L-alanyl-D-glutamate endopeptidase CwlK
MIECAIDLVKFADSPFVIERPADADVIADAATRILARSGLRLDFGAAKTTSAHAQTAAAAFPEGAALLDRGSGRILPDGAHKTAIVAGPTRAPASDDPACLMALQSWKMLGHSIVGSDKEQAALFAHVLAVRQGVPDSVLAEDQEATSRSEALGPRRGSISKSLLLLRSQRAKMEGARGFFNSDAEKIALLASSFSTRLSSDRHARMDALPVVQASLPAADNPFMRRGTSPQLGEAFPTHDEVADIPRFEERPYGSAPEGPSYLPDTFNETSKSTIQGIHPDLLKVVARAREMSKIDFEVVPKTGGIRTEALQRKLKAGGHSQAKIGRHTIGYAIDLVPVRNGRIDFKDMNGFEEIRNAMAKAAEELDVPIQWGGNWKKLVDKPHFELDRKVYPLPGEEADPSALQVAFR